MLAANNKLEIEALKAAIAQQTGYNLHKVDGQWVVTRIPGAVHGLGPKHSIMVKVGVKPKGSPGRGKGDGGYNLQKALGMNNIDYDLVYENCKTILQNTHGIDTNLPIMKQDSMALKTAVDTRDGYQKKYGERKQRKSKKAPTVNKAMDPQPEGQPAPAANPVPAAATNQAPAAGPVAAANPAPSANPAPATDLAPAGKRAPANKPANVIQDQVAATRNEDDAGEYFDLRLPGNNDDDDDDAAGARDMTMHDSSRIHVRPDRVIDMSIEQGTDSNTDKDEDGGMFDISQMTGILNLSRRQDTPTSTTRSSNPSLTGESDLARIPSSTSEDVPISPLGTVLAPKHSALTNKSCTIRSVRSSSPLSSPLSSPPPSPPPSRSSSPPPSAPTGIATHTRTTRSKATTDTSISPPAPTIPTPEPASQDNTPVTQATNIVPFSSTVSDSSTVWRGIPISATVMKQLGLMAMRQAEGQVVRTPPMYQDLVDMLAVDPSYNPSSDPCPPPVSSTPAARGGRGGRVKGKSAGSIDNSTLHPTLHSTAVKPKLKATPELEPEPEPESEAEAEPEAEVGLGDDEDIDLIEPRENRVLKTRKVPGTSKSAATKGKSAAKTSNTGKGKGGKEVAEVERAPAKVEQSTVAAEDEPVQEAATVRHSGRKKA